jgi:hypothetical protein
LKDSRIFIFLFFSTIVFFLLQNPNNFFFIFYFDGLVVKQHINILVLWGLMPLSTIFQLDGGSIFDG